MEYLVLILLFHFIADFLFQSDDMAMNKSWGYGWLTMHTGVYTAVLMSLMMMLFKNIEFAVFFATINGAGHWIIDAVTSRINTKLWKEEKRHWFFTMIGFDQFLHTALLLITLPVQVIV
jgi:hypothetical protein